jgi:hypothetical protein
MKVAIAIVLLALGVGCADSRALVVAALPPIPRG